MTALLAWLIVVVSAGLPALTGAAFFYHVISKAQTLSSSARRWESSLAMLLMAAACVVAMASIYHMRLLPEYDNLIEVVTALSAIATFIALFALFRAFGLLQWWWL